MINSKHLWYVSSLYENDWWLEYLDLSRIKMEMLNGIEIWSQLEHIDTEVECLQNSFCKVGLIT